MIFKKQAKGKFEQISDFSLNKSLQASYKCPWEICCEYLSFFCECQPWPSSRQVSASEPAAAWCSMQSYPLSLCPITVFWLHLFRRAFVYITPKYSTEVSRELEVVMLFLLYLINLRHLPQASPFYICPAGFAECVTSYSSKCIYLARSSGMLVTHTIAT